MSDNKRDKELLDTPPGMREPAQKAPGEGKSRIFDIRSKVALISFMTLLILAFVVLSYLVFFAWRHIPHDGDIFSIKRSHRGKLTHYKDMLSIKKTHREKLRREKDHEKIRNRRREMFALGKKGDPKGISSVARTLRRSGDPDERVDAAMALGEFKHHLVVEPLIDALDDKNKKVREEAIDSLSESHDLRALNALIEILSSEDDPLRVSAADGLGHFKHPLATDALIDALSDEEEDVRRHTIFALAKIGDSRIVEQLNKIQDETTDKRLQHDIMAVLNQIDDPKTSKPLSPGHSDLSTKDINALIAALKSNEKKLVKNTYNYDRTIFLETVEALGETGDVRAEKALLNLLEKDYHHQTATEIIKAISKIGSPYSMPPLINKLDDPNKMVVDSANLALISMVGIYSKKKEYWKEWWDFNKKDITKYNSDDMVASFIVALDDSNPAVRLFAAGFLGRMKDTRAVEPLIKLFYSEDCDKYTCRAILKVLIEMKVPRSTEMLIASLDKDDGYSKSIAVRALGDSNDPAAVEPLIKALRNSNKTLAVEGILYALGKLGDPRAMDAILEKLESPDPRIRKDAARALEGAGDMSAMPYLKKALDDDDKYVRVAAARAILVIDGRCFYEKEQGEE